MAFLIQNQIFLLRQTFAMEPQTIFTWLYPHMGNLFLWRREKSYLLSFINYVEWVIYVVESTYCQNFTQLPN